MSKTQELINSESLFELHKNLCFQMDVVYSEKNYTRKHLGSLKNYGKRFCSEFNAFIDINRNIFDIFNDENIIENIEKFCESLKIHNPQRNGYYHEAHRVLHFVLDYVIEYKGTKHWITVDTTNFNIDLPIHERFLFSLSYAQELIRMTYHSISQETAYKHLANKIKELSGITVKWQKLREYNQYYKKMPIWVHDENIDSSCYMYTAYLPISVAKAIETLANAPKGYLLDLISIAPNPFSIDKNEAPKKKLRTLSKQFDISLINNIFREEIKLYAEYKTLPLINKKRNDKWVVRTQQLEYKKAYKTILDATISAELSVLRSDKSIPSFEIFVAAIIFICRHALNFGLLEPNQLSLYSISHVEIIEKIFNKLINENEYTTSNAESISSICAALWNVDACFFVEYSEIFSNRYGVSKEELIEKSKDYSERFKKLRSQIRPYIKTSEFSHKLLNEKVLSLNNPSAYVFNTLNNAKIDLVRLIDRSNDISDKAARLIRDICFISCILSCPLRVRNWANMKLGYYTDSECIYFDESKNCYVLSVPKELFKNYRQKNIPDFFKLEIISDFTDVISDYIYKARPILTNEHKNDYFFVTGRSKRVGERSLNTIVKSFSEKYDSHNLRIGGMNIHGFRAIVATTFLKKFKGAFAYAAFLLLDSEEMIREHYGHLSPDDAFSDWGQILSQKGDN